VHGFISDHIEDEVTRLISLLYLSSFCQHAKLIVFGGQLECIAIDFYHIIIFHYHILRHLPTPIGCFQSNIVTESHYKGAGVILSYIIN
jgi:hypothetical protein